MRYLLSRPFSRLKLSASLRLAVFFLLVGSFFLNYFLLQRAISYYQAIHRLRIDPSETSFLGNHEDLTKPNAQGCSIVMFGDSRIANWQPKLLFPGCSIINKGIRGQTTEQLKLRIVKDVLAFTPDVVIIQAGINDLKTIGIFREKKIEIVERCKANLSEITDRIAKQRIQVFLLTIFPTGRPGYIRSWFWSQDCDEARIKVNNAIKGIQMQNVHVIDVESVLGIEGYMRPEYVKDMVHINQYAYGKLNEWLQPLLQGMLSTEEH